MENKKVNIEKLKQEYPSRVTPSSMKKYLAYIFGTLLALIGIVGVIINILNILGSTSATFFGSDIIGIIICFAISIAGFALFKRAPHYTNASGITPFVMQCQNIYDEILNSNLAKKDKREYSNYQKYSLDYLFDIYKTIDRKQNKVRFATISYIIKEKLE